MNPNNGNNNHDVAIKAIIDAVNEAHEWSAFVPFFLSDSPNELNFALIDIFSMVCMQPYEKELYFQPKHKQSEKLPGKYFLEAYREKHAKMTIHWLAEDHKMVTANDFLAALDTKWFLGSENVQKSNHEE